MRYRWLGATGTRVPEIAVDGDDLAIVGPGRIRVGGREVEALVLDEIGEEAELQEAHVFGTPVVVRARDAETVAAALAHPQVACALVPGERAELRELDLRRLKYG